ncbi:histone-lysine N-methyltransferase PR-Set7-like isoform X2 [Anthonomus grandis grandis]|uniref:histone-lysine N-methyltransferase PR-Set7-like isoform X2 n=1 Tax=Anthonomus grandis grandis TaxID=2921223 RepID=UPI002164FE40|nr:histone-lysine N-methyltransferase PR-Set7-like isoform X2 [Anthonomus grandis grandis]
MVRASASATAALPTTPIQMQTRRQKLLNGSMTSPPTPHRIELRAESNEENNRKKPLICQPPAPKARKKLINNHIGTNNNCNNNNNGEIKETIKSNGTNNHKFNGQQKLTEFFPVRRSVRKTKTTVLEEQQMALEKMVRNKIEDGLEVRIFKDKGRGVVAAKPFQKGDFVIEYSGELVDILEAKEREELYAQNENAGCYMYYFKHNGIQYCIDATEETGRLGRLVNHSRSNPNLVTKTLMVDKKPRLVLIAKEDIKEGEEILYDYGDRSKESLQHHPWLAY